MVMIMLDASAFEGPMLMMICGCLGGSGLGNGSQSLMLGGFISRSLALGIYFPGTVWSPGTYTRGGGATSGGTCG